MSRPSDPVALRSPVMLRFFARVMDRQLGRNFHAVRLARPGLPDLPEGRPLMVVANHPSFWDPALFMALATRLFPQRESYGPIDAEMLRRYRFMARIGLFGVAQGDPRGAAQFLRTAQPLVEDPGRMLWITAQGHFADPRDRPLRLQPGAAHLLARVPGLMALPLAVEYPFWTESRPEALACFGAPVEARPGEGPEAANARLTGALEAAQDRLAGLSQGRDASAFDRLLGGRAGVGGIYDAFGRARAAMTGRRWQAEHMPQERADK
ncbi:lysophospholipid acyltransferase family protein [Pseudoroseicyclus aestuarii]|nr:lysophospholipid acyltransferase family protein [Pseudoroseicyclus aestuarii]